MTPMTATIELFDRFKQRLELVHDSAAAERLGVKAQTVSNWRNRGSQAEPRLIEAMCRALDVDATAWVLRAQAEQAHDPANGAVWRRLAARIGTSAAALSALAAGFDLLLERLQAGNPRLLRLSSQLLDGWLPEPGTILSLWP